MTTGRINQVATIHHWDPAGNNPNTQNSFATIIPKPSTTAYTELCLALAKYIKFTHSLVNHYSVRTTAPLVGQPRQQRQTSHAAFHSTRPRYESRSKSRQPTLLSEPKMNSKQQHQSILPIETAPSAWRCS